MAVERGLDCGCKSNHGEICWQLCLLAGREPGPQTVINLYRLGVLVRLRPGLETFWLSFSSPLKCEFLRPYLLHFVGMLVCRYVGKWYVGMYACMYVCVCMYVCMCVYVCMYVCLSVCLYVCMYVCVYVCMYVCMCVCMCVCVYVCMYVCMYVCVYLCMYVCMYACMHACMCAFRLAHNCSSDLWLFTL